MKVSLIHASPKMNGSTSAILLEYLKSKLSSDVEIRTYPIRHEELSNDTIAKIFHADAIVFAVPVYMDSLPSHLLSPLHQIESYIKTGHNRPVIYTIINGGFYEGHRSSIAIDIMKNWSKKAGLQWGQALGTGAGDMHSGLSNIPIGKGPSVNLGKALNKFAKTIHCLGEGEDLFVSPNIPRFAWKMGASVLVWNRRAKANGLSKKDLYLN